MVDLARLVSRASAAYRNDVAVVDGTLQRTFGEVEDRSNRLANVFGGLVARAGARVALLMSNCAQFVESDLAILKAGLVKVPINPRLTESEREHILRHSGAELVVFAPEHAAFVAAMRDRVPTLRQAVALGPCDLDVPAYEELLTAASAREPRLTIDPDAPSFILYTSGTTGRPKGAVSTFRSRLAATVHMLADELDVREGDGMVHVGHLSHGSGSKILAFYLRGARNIVVPKFDPEAFFDVVARERGTGSFMVPTMLGLLCDSPARQGKDIGSLRTVSYGGAPIAPALLRRAVETFGPIFVQVYGSCEAPHPVTVMRKDEHVRYLGDDKHLSSLGREATAVEVRLVNAEGEEVAEGTAGEILIRGGNVMQGYWNDPGATADVFRGDFYRSGDAAVRGDDGYLYMVDRVRDLIITGGLNVYPAEVEAALLSHPAIAEAAVIGVPDEVWGENVKAFVSLRPGMTCTADELIEHSRKRLAGYKKPKSVEFLATLPKGSTGKILKREIREKYWAGRSRAV